MVLRETECDGERLYEAVKELLGDRERLSGMEKAVQSMAVPDSAEKIYGIILELAGR